MADKKEQLGLAGEKIVANYFSSLGKKVELSINPFDSTKDLIVDGKHIEVKTQVPWCQKDSFTFRPNQLKKILASDLIIFISVPNTKMKHFSSGKVYECTPENMFYTKQLTRNDREMILVKINQESIKELFELSKAECKLLQKYSSSDWN